MKKISRSILFGAILLITTDVIYVTRVFVTMNLLKFLLFVVFIPCVLLSAVISSITVEMNIKKSKTQGIVASCFSAGLSIIAYTLAIKNQKGIEYIIENSRQMVENPNLTIGNIEISNSLSSYFFIFIIIVVCTMIFNTLYSLLKEVNFTGYTQHLMK